LLGVPIFCPAEFGQPVGVQDAAVNLMLHNATVTFDPGVTSVSALVDTIRGTGYGAEIPAQQSSILEEQAEHDEEQLREIQADAKSSDPLCCSCHSFRIS
jgi:Cu+-exporting ATPase